MSSASDQACTLQASRAVVRGGRRHANLSRKVRSGTGSSPEPGTASQQSECLVMSSARRSLLSLDERLSVCSSSIRVPSARGI